MVVAAAVVAVAVATEIVEVAVASVCSSSRRESQCMQILISQTYIFTLRRNDWQHMHGVSLSLLLLTVVAEALVPPQPPKPPQRRLLVLCPTSAGEIASEISESIAALRRDGSTVQIIAHRLSMRTDAVNASTRMGAELVAHGVLPNAHIVSICHSPIFSPIFPYITTLDLLKKRDFSVLPVFFFSVRPV